LTPTKTTFVEWGLSRSSLSSSSTGTSFLFTDGDPAGRTNRTMHQATMFKLLPSTLYYYHVGDKQNNNFSPIFSFMTMDPDIGRKRIQRVGVYGDFGYYNDQEFEPLETAVWSNEIDFIIHAGDFAYDMDIDNGTRGDLFMEMIENITSHVPYMVCPGNHEYTYNFSHYQARFAAMPGADSGTNTNLYFSYNVGNVHYVAINTEMYYFSDMYSMSNLERQYNWLIADLTKANKQRNIRPWIIVYGHRPMYCTDIQGNGNMNYCTVDTAALRDGVNYDGGPRLYALETVLYQFGVDIFFAGHMHSYERLYPTYRNQLLSSSYVNPAAPIHIVIGAAGCQEDLDLYDGDTYPWSAFRADKYGFGVMNIYNDTHIYWVQYDNEDKNLLDDVWIVKDDRKEYPLYGM